MTAFLPFALPDIGEEEIAEVVDTLRSGWLSTGPKVQRFEQEFAAFLGSGIETVAVNSATSGLHLALVSAGIKPGDEVITSAYTFTGAAGAIRQAGARPVFVDVDPATFNLDISQISDVVTERSRAIMPVHFAGLSCPMDELRQVAARHNLAIIEDAAHALPARYRGQWIGASDSTATVFSFYATKPLATGEGGMIVCRDPLLARRARAGRFHGIERDMHDRYRANHASWYYEVHTQGFKYNMTDIQAAIGIHQLRKVERLRNARQSLAETYDAALRSLPLCLPPRSNDDDVHAWHLYVIRLRDDAPVTREQFVDKMLAQGIGCSVHFMPLPMHPFWRNVSGQPPENFPHAVDVWRRAVSLPLYTRMTPSDQARVIDTVRSILTQAGS